MNNIIYDHDHSDDSLLPTTTVSFDKPFVLKLFNLDNKAVTKFDIYRKANAVHVAVELARQTQICPVCGSKTTTVSNYVDKTINHSILNNIPCYIDYHARRYKCPVCRKTFYEHNPFVIDGMRIAIGTVCNVLKDLQSFNATFKSISQRYNISQSEVARIFDNHVDMPRLPLPKYLCIDEVYAFKSDHSRYVCVLLDFKTQKIVDLLPSRRKYELKNYFDKIPTSERNNVQIVSTDMWETYRYITASCFPNAVIAVDKFHVIQEFTKHFTRIRVDAMNRYQVDKKTWLNRANLPLAKQQELIKNDRRYYVFKKFNWLLLKTDDDLIDPNKEKKFNHKLQAYKNFSDLLDIMLEDQAVLEAYNFYYRLTNFYKTCTRENAKEQLELLIIDLEESNLNGLVKYANTLKKWKVGIINSFNVIDGNNRKINNGVIENINKTIKNMKHNANGFTNWSRFRNRVLYVVNKGTYNINSKKKN